jgi:cytoskeleton protein RodZ
MSRRRPYSPPPPAARPAADSADNTAAANATPEAAAAILVLDDTEAAYMPPHAEPAPAAFSPAPAPTPQRPQTVSEQLRDARTARGETLLQIAEWLRIRPDYLAALENGQHENLPALTYAMGFLRTYADYLGLDKAALSVSFRQEMADKLTPQLAMPQPLPEGKIPPLPIILGTLLLAGLIYGVWAMSSTPAPHTPPQPPQPPALNTTSKPPSSNSAAALPKPQNPAPPAAATTPPPALLPADGESQTTTPLRLERQFGELDKPTRRSLRAVREVWLTITDDKDVAVFSQMLQPGDRYHIPDRAGLKLTTGNADNLELLYDGKALPPLGKAGQVVRDIALDTVLK